MRTKMPKVDECKVIRRKITDGLTELEVHFDVMYSGIRGRKLTRTSILHLLHECKQCIDKVKEEAA